MRKYLLPTAVLILFSLESTAQVEMGFAYGLGIPIKEMAKHIQPAHQGVISLNYRLPGKHPQFSVGLETGFGSYAHKTINQTFQFRDGSTTKADVRYSSNIAYMNAVFRYDIPIKGNLIPYLHMIGGYNAFYTSIYVENPDDPTGCKPLQNQNTFADDTFTWGFGTGMRIKLNEKTRRQGGSSYMLDIAVTNVYGGNLEYLNVKHLKEHDHTDPVDPDTKTFTSRFINVNTQDIHEHKLAEIYNSNLRLLQVRIGFVMQFGKMGCKSKSTNTSAKKIPVLF